jgi:hypothetical protein
LDSSGNAACSYARTHQSLRQRSFEIEHALKPAAIRKNRARLICCE